MPDLIDRRAAHNMVRQLERYAWSSPDRTEHHITVDVDDVQFGIDKLPTVVPESLVRHGRWEVVSWHTIRCSECKRIFDIMKNDTEVFHHCPNCGAKMVPEITKGDPHGKET